MPIELTPSHTAAPEQKKKGNSNEICRSTVYFINNVSHTSDDIAGFTVMSLLYIRTKIVQV